MSANASRNFCTALFLWIGLISFSQNSDAIQQAKAFQKELNRDFADPKKSPLTKKDFKQFSSLSFFEIDTTYSLVADFIRTPHEQPFVMPTTTNREALYVKYGELHFKLYGKVHQLNVYQNQRLANDPTMYKQSLFIPFTDLTNGAETYAGGRYLDFPVPEEDTQTVKLDFNHAYNPYCAYSGRYSCPIPPKENALNIPIRAGVKAFKE